MGIKFTPIDKMDSADLPDGLNIPDATKEDKQWVRKIKSSLKTDGDFYSETIQQIRAGNLCRVIWLTSQPYKTYDGDFTDRILNKGRWKNGVANQGSYKNLALEAIKLQATEPSGAHKDILNYCLYGVGRHCYVSRFLTPAVVTAMDNDADFDIYDQIFKENTPSDDVLKVCINRENYQVFKYLADINFKKRSGGSVSGLLVEALTKPDARYAEYIINKAPANLSIETTSRSYAIEAAVKADRWVDWCIDKGADPDVVLYHAVKNEKFDLANRVLEEHKANLDAVSTELVGYAVSNKKSAMIEYLVEKGVNPGKAIEYVQEPRNVNNTFSQNLREVFKKHSVNVRPITWSLEDDCTIRRTVRTPKLETNWLFYFGEQTLIQFTKGRGGDDDLPATERMWQFSEFSNQALIQEAKEALERQGGQAPEYVTGIGPSASKPVKLKSVKKP